MRGGLASCDPRVGPAQPGGGGIGKRVRGIMRPPPAQTAGGRVGPPGGRWPLE